MTVELNLLQQASFDPRDVFAKLYEEIPMLQTRQTVTFRLGLAVNDDSVDTPAEFEWEPMELVWRDVPYEVTLELQELFIKLVEFFAQETEQWGLDMSRIREEAGPDPEAVKRALKQGALEMLKTRRQQRQGGGEA